MPSKKQKDDQDKIADDFTLEEIDERLVQTLAHLADTGGPWPGLVRLPADDKNGNVGKLLSQLSPPLRSLFQAITPLPGEDAKLREVKAKLAAVFDTMLGSQDRGKDDARFEADLLMRRLARAEAELKIVAALEELRARFADDALNTAEMVIEPGIRALEVARTAAASNPEFRSLLAPVLDQLGDMTKKARRRQEEARKAAAKPKPEQP